MSEFFRLLPPDESRDLWFRHFTAPGKLENARSQDALGRVTGRSVRSLQDLPDFDRSTMDGFAVRAADTFGASDALPAMLTVVGEIPMGSAAEQVILPAQCLVVHTGGMVPQGADAVVQIEHTHGLPGERNLPFPFDIEVYRAVAAGQNLVRVGEDVRNGQEMLPAGHLIRAQDIGGLLALGILEIEVVRKPKVAIMSTGDEVVDPDVRPGPGQVRDINAYTTAALVEKMGGVPIHTGVIRDDPALILEKAADALERSDMLVISAGSSVSTRDSTAEVINNLGEPGVVVHGVATKPGKPTILGVAAGKPLLGLPGNPVSAMVQFVMFGVPAIYRLQGMDKMPPPATVWARCSKNLSSESGREDYVPAKLEQTPSGMVATPIFGKSNLIFTLVHSDGLIKIPLDQAGIVADEWVEVIHFT